MMNNDQRPQSESIRLSTQEMRQAFSEWMENLPILKRVTPEDPEWEGPDEGSAYRESGSRPTGGAVMGQSTDNGRGR
jgi:hypothetical protein